MESKNSLLDVILEKNAPACKETRTKRYLVALAAIEEKYKHLKPINIQISNSIHTFKRTEQDQSILVMIIKIHMKGKNVVKINQVQTDVI